MQGLALSPAEFSRALLHWFDHYGRHDLPWQQGINPYRVWVSEIMLQQTQVTTVIPYFDTFMQHFPHIQDLAAAHVDEVLTLWSGLGYYARGRNLHKAAVMIMSDFGGEFPQDIDQLQSLPGVGRSTAGAIAAIALQQHAPILDGNVKRVLTRYFSISGWTGKAEVLKTLWQVASDYTPAERCADYTQAIMDLGATVCTRSKPDCQRCPLHASCSAYANGNPTEFPSKKPRKQIPTRQTFCLILRSSQQEVLLEKRPDKGIWGGLWSLPECELEQDIATKLNLLPANIINKQKLTPFRHTFSHYHLDISPIVIHIHQLTDLKDDQRWVSLDEPMKVGLPQPVKKILEQLIKKTSESDHL